MHDVIVIGAGMAGVTAAREVAHHGLGVVVLEAQDRVGGRMWTDRDFAGAPVERGAEFIHTDKAATLAEAEAGGFALIRCNPADGYLMSIGGVRSPELYADPSLAAMGDLLGAIETYDGPEQSAAEFVEARGLTGAARVMAEQMLTVHPLGDLHEVSMHGLRGDRVIELERGVDYRLVDGYDALPRWIAEGLDVRTGTRVASVAWSDAGVVVTTEAGERLEARSGICTLPVGVLKRGTVRFEPDLPASKWRALNGLEMGAVMKLLYRFEERFWPEDLTMLGCDGPIRLWWTPLLGREDAAPVLTAYVGGYRARALSGLTEADALAVGAHDLDRLFPEVRPSRLVRDARRVDWCTNPFTNGGYSFIRVGGAGSRAALAAPDTGALFWAGDGTATATIAAVVHAAYDTGRRAAGEVAGHLSR